GYPAGEMKHGPIALITDALPVVVVAPRDPVFPKTLGNMKEVESRGGRLLAVTDEPTDDLQGLCSDVIVVPKAHPFVAPFVLTVPLQLLAYHVAVGRGTDVDQPRNLAKSVTVE
ncbi:MAG: SIS domain-containing protein, partial [Candidatus Binatia bacterium]